MAKKRTQDRHKDKSRSYRLRQEIVDLLDKLAESQRRSKTTIIEMALEKLGSENGLWPPSKESGS